MKKKQARKGKGIQNDDGDDEDSEDTQEDKEGETTGAYEDDEEITADMLRDEASS